MGNEIPTDVVRLHGIPAVQDQHSELVRHLHDGERSLLAIHVRLPTTEYLDVEGIDFLALNVCGYGRQRDLVDDDGRR
jgi:hypothetical protein